MKESAEAWRKEDVWSVVVSLSLVQVALFVESTAEDDAAPAQSRPSPREWYFGDPEYSGKQRDLENPLVVGTTTRRKPCTCIYTTPRGERLRQCLEHFVARHPQVLSLQRKSALPSPSGCRLSCKSSLRHTVRPDPEVPFMNLHRGDCRWKLHSVVGLLPPKWRE